jgi:hypothetical protein
VVGGCYWINLTQYRDRWRALLNTVMNLCAGNFLAHRRLLLLASQEELCSMELVSIQNNRGGSVY